MAELFMPLPKDGSDYPCTTVEDDYCPNKAVTGLTPETYERLGILIMRKQTKIHSSMRAVCQVHANLIERDLHG